MDLVLLKCAKCRAKIGRLPNLWTQIGRKYITQAGDARDGHPSPSLRVEAAGSVRGQIIFRMSSVTLKSDSDQRRAAQLKIRNILKLRSPSAATATAAPQLQEESPSRAGFTISVEKAGSAPGNPGLEFAQMQTDLEAQKREIQRIGATGFQVVSSFETNVARFEQQMKRMSLSIESVRDDQQAGRKDLSTLRARVSELQRQQQPPHQRASSPGLTVQSSGPDVARLEAQMKAVEKSVGELRQGYQRARSEAAGLRDELRQAQHQLQQVRDDNAALRSDVREAYELAKEGVDTSRLHAAEAASLRREMQQLRADLASGGLQAPPPPPMDDSYSASFFQTHSHELDILASNISKIGHRASQIESLQMEFQLFRSRIQRLEAKSGSCTPVRSDHGSAFGGELQHGTSLQRFQYPGSRVGSSTHPLFAAGASCPDPGAASGEGFIS
ncbi:hypothetical protein ESCO_005550 [Escovopsis weberi]|uniref:Uncharacterized protein n=1 Tax=Escovopsis weberi TaxID=150374 RepID=A0A0M8N5U1_ESCWE|nr:hypothetical protein ESCO_005550 [Escovopsis weberi]